MYVDLPQINKCCFCFPLRYGLQIWGYIKLILVMLFTIFAVVKTWWYLVICNFMTAFTIIYLVFILDIIFSIILIIATHKKNEKLFEIYYNYSLVVAVLFVVALLLNLGLIIFILIENSTLLLFELYMCKANVLSILASLLLQTYIALLVRSELTKLRDRSNMQFFNHISDGGQLIVTLDVQKDSSKDIESV